MALQVRRGLSTDRTSITPVAGELLYTTDTKNLYVGDGSTAGGNIISGAVSTNLDGLTDVVITGTPSVGQVLKYDGTNWINDSGGGGVGTVTSVSGTGTINGLTLTGTVTSTGNLTLGGTLSNISNSALTNSSITVNGTNISLGGNGTLSINSLGLVNIATPTPNQILKYDGANWVNTSSVVSLDSSPTLSGNLTLNNRNITGTGGIDISGTIKSYDLTINSRLITTNNGTLSLGSNTDQVDEVLIKGSYVTHRGLVTGPGTLATNIITVESSRGSVGAPTVVLNGDLLGGYAISGYNNGNYNLKGFMIGRIDTVTGTNPKPGSIVFYVEDYNENFLEAASMDSRGRLTAVSMTATNGLTTNSVASTSNTNLVLTASGTGKISLDGVFWPAADGTNGQVLTTDGAGNLSWGTGVSSLSSRSQFAVTTSSIADGTSTDATITNVYKGYFLLKINVDKAAWVRIYTDAASRTADASRAEGVDPAPGAGVIAEVVTTGSQTILMSPGVLGWNNESPVTTDIPIAVKNKSGSTNTITVTVTVVKLEA